MNSQKRKLTSDELNTIIQLLEIVTLQAFVAEHFTTLYNHTCNPDAFGPELRRKNIIKHHELPDCMKPPGLYEQNRRFYDKIIAADDCSGYVNALAETDNVKILNLLKEKLPLMISQDELKTYSTKIQSSSNNSHDSSAENSTAIPTGKPLVVSAVTVAKGGKMKSQNVELSVNIPSNLLSKAAGTGSELHGINVKGDANLDTIKSTVKVRDKDTAEMEVFDDGIFSNIFHPTRWNSSGLPSYELLGKCYVLIICNIFKGNEKLYRIGAKEDIADMEELFKSLNCDIMVETNVFEHEVDGILQTFKKKLVSGGYGSSIVVIMTHGGKSANSILMDDGKPKNLYRDIVYQFGHSPNTFPEFKGKPKIFLVQACQDYGDEEIEDASCSDKVDGQLPIDSTTSKHLMKVSIEDVLVSSATTPYQRAKRTLDGSFYIQAIKEVFGKKAKTGSTLRSMLYEVHQIVKKKCLEFNVPEQNVTTYESGFKKYVFNLK